MTNTIKWLKIVCDLYKNATADEDADERYVLDPVGSEKATPIIKGGVIDDAIWCIDVKLETVRSA